MYPRQVDGRRPPVPRSLQIRSRRGESAVPGFRPWRWWTGRRRPAEPAAVDPEAVEGALAAARDGSGESLASLTRTRPRLVVLLRHLGCAFCREALADLARQRRSIEEAGTGIVLVHQARDEERARRLFAIYKLDGVPRIADPDLKLYEALGLAKGDLGQLVGPRILARTLAAACRGHLHGRIEGDVRQMPGVFLIHRGRVVRQFRHRHSAERPDYLALAAGAPAARAE